MAYAINSLTDRVGSTTYRMDSSKDLNGLSRRFFDWHIGYDRTLIGEYQPISLAHMAISSTD
jgi:hypothetical protein